MGKVIWETLYKHNEKSWHGNEQIRHTNFGKLIFRKQFSYFLSIFIERKSYERLTYQPKIVIFIKLAENVYKLKTVNEIKLNY